MWHLKTNMGVFWVIPVADASNKYYLGVNDHALGEYKNAAQAAKDVHNQATGYYKWDAQPRIRVPEDIGEWQEGEPNEWH